ncbi:phage portal protein [Nocardiopsis composta]|uniref:A118 family predicted phage portal protein n=2 Tax=Nocardiopsis composta TaxID=157465 RepID=A0A7W8QKA6_9ACTN|nr:phage portal protein [Nocardiopsis composta]MBB5431340.1 A118 family predicted phage portal protein [Nocardiopsis composta]
MPLPDRDAPWPPKSTELPQALYDTWGAWYSGRPDELARVYGGANSANRITPAPRPSQYRGGVVGTVARWFWGRPPNAEQQPSRLHVPLAGDIAATSADLLFGEPPTLAAEDPATQERLEYLMDEGGMHAALLEGAELASAYGGVFLRVSWNRALAGHPIVEPIAPDCAAPEWAGQHLRAVTFWRVLSEPDATVVVRHLERHEAGRVFHGLYEGGRDSLGTKVPLTEHPETAGFADAVGPDGGIATGAERIAVEYLPNMRPNRIIRGTPLGRSDYAGVEHLMDALDEAWSSWMRDIRLAKARLVVPEAWLETQGRGQAAMFDVEREFYAPLKMLQGAGDSAGQLMELFQPEIRVAEHAQTCTELSEQIVRGAGFSAQTFGESRDLAVTATEVTTRERRTYSTRARKIQYAGPRLAALAETALEIDKAQFASKVKPQRPVVTWPDGVQESPTQVATTAELLSRARAASTQTLVQIVHPEWDEAQVAEEVGRIEAADQPPPWMSAGLISTGRRVEEAGDGGTEQAGAGESGGEGPGAPRRGGQRRPVPDPQPRRPGQGDPRRGARQGR